MRPDALTALLAALCMVAARGAGAKPASQRVASLSGDAEAVEELTALLEVESKANLRSRASSPFVESMAPTSQQEGAVEASFPWDHINLHPDDCSTGPTYSTNLPAGYDSVTVRRRHGRLPPVAGRTLSHPRRRLRRAGGREMQPLQAHRGQQLDVELEVALLGALLARAQSPGGPGARGPGGQSPRRSLPLTGAPVPQCKHYACRMASGCPEFITSRCMEGGAERFPCPAKYVCWNCLHIPGKQYAGCFDD